MRRFPSLGALLVIPAAALFLAAAGCSGGGDKKGTNPPATTPPTTPEGGKKAADGGAKGGEKLTASTDGVIKGTIKADNQKEGDLTPVMAKHADKEHCLAAPEDQKVEQDWIVGKDGGLANVIVYLKAPDGKSFNVTDELKQNFKSPAVLDQPYCVFVPHIVTLYPDAGQALLVKNSAKVPHNTNLQGNPLKNPPKNVTLKPGGEETIKIKHQDTPLNVKCDLHTWMNAKIKTFDHPYFAVTDKDGNFEIKNVPTGVELTVVTWHEVAGEQQQKQTFKAGDNPLDLKVAKK